ncbi:hypothetical protein F3Y22_tig00110610pilonHSYRG00558 [Hibiscus syriacus]|uniref:Generative cell specific-1/HAP2 domain-containing protein n=1 Tax=Hibiscus syriacus TaxID=106335 RepID=A0A6A3A0J9_HIBSY|nr:hypothetical protein F3Y22_tig00110610pilonHSYRG00558 [Hibiscus syriacus]
MYRFPQSFVERIEQPPKAGTFILWIYLFHVFGIGQQSIGFSVRIEVKTGNKVLEVIVRPENRTATSADKFLRVNLIGDFVGYSSIPTFEDFYLVIPRQVWSGIEVSEDVKWLSQVENAGTRKSRGRTTLKELYQLPPGHRAKVSRNDAGQPIGLEACLLAGYLGIVERNVNLLPINYESWHEMPNSNKNQALDFVKEIFSLEVSNDYVKQALGKRWRDHKSSLKKKNFKNDLSLEEKLQTVLLGMLRYQWEDADREHVGVASRQQQRFTHTVGSKSFACTANEEENTYGSKVGRIQLFDMTHKKKDVIPMTSEAAEIMQKFREKRAEYHATASSQGLVNDDDIENQAINDVLGPERYGRLRCQGSFVTPTKYFGYNFSQYMSSQSQSLQLEVSSLKQKLSEMDQQMANMKVENEAREAERAAAEAARAVAEAEKEAATT